jgi:hypothetical protein
MTLFMATPTRDGIVLAADQRTWDPLRGVRDDQEKVVRLGTHTAFATTGLPCYERFFFQPPAPPVFIPLYDAAEVIREFYGAADPLFPESTQGLADRLMSTFAEHLRRLPFPQWPECAGPPDDILYQAVFVQYCRRAGAFRYVLAKFLYRKDRQDTLPGVRWREADPKRFGLARSLPAGNLAVYHEVVGGNDPQFDDLRGHPGVRRFLIELTPAEGVSAEEAVEFSRFFIQECSRRTPLLDGSPYQIGPTCDVAVIGKDGGFSWVK